MRVGSSLSLIGFHSVPTPVQDGPTVSAPLSLPGAQGHWFCLLLLLIVLVFPPMTKAQGHPVEQSLSAPLTIVALGDSLTAGLGLAPAEAFPAQLERFLRSRGIHAEVVNMGISGATTDGGRNAVGWALEADPDLVIVELGANDMLRGMDPDRTEENLRAIIETFREQNVQVLLAGMRAPDNLGREYASRFNAVFPRLAREYDLAFYPFFLEGVAGVEDLNQMDGIHPTAGGIEEIVQRIGPMVADLLQTSER